jgi:hypothetical protein
VDSIQRETIRYLNGNTKGPQRRASSYHQAISLKDISKPQILPIRLIREHVVPSINLPASLLAILSNTIDPDSFLWGCERVAAGTAADRWGQGVSASVLHAEQEVDGED